ncbi:DUF1778 domain-containing protein [Stenoxybacter acetivorans]|uniref:type II toxin-antitoxin system TacA family antitoxin n=1 Tax=Stenoxybacter acetivorans TaxID=422441 RepID=UPI000689BC65|nr:DUF1778 domain-containing protein [Stenoxybacter acetivorans]
MNLSERKSERINLRLSQEVKQAIERAAVFEGKTVSNFIVSSALDYAEKSIRQHERIHLEKQHAQAFLDALSQPLTFNQALQNALSEHAQHVDSN